MPAIICVPGRPGAPRTSQPTRSSGWSSCSPGKEPVATEILGTKRAWPAFLGLPRAGSGASRGWEWECCIYSSPNQKRQEFTGLKSQYFYWSLKKQVPANMFNFFLGAGVGGQDSSPAASTQGPHLPLRRTGEKRAGPGGTWNCTLWQTTPW